MSEPNNELITYRFDQIDKQLAELKADQKATKDAVTEVKTELSAYRFGAKVTSFIGGVVGAILFFIADHLWKKP